MPGTAAAWPDGTRVQAPTWPGLRRVAPGILSVMPMVRKPRLGPRGALAFTMGIAAIFDVTGAMVYRTMRGVLPPAPVRDDDGSDPFRAAMEAIVSSHHDAMVAAGDESRTALPE